MAQQNTATLQHAKQHDTILKSVDDAIKERSTNLLKLSLEFHSRIDDMFQFLMTTNHEDIQQNAVRVRKWKQDLFSKHLLNLREMERDFDRELEHTLTRLRYASFARLTSGTMTQDVERFPIPPMVPSLPTITSDTVNRRNSAPHLRARDVQRVRGSTHRIPRCTQSMVKKKREIIDDPMTGRGGGHQFDTVMVHRKRDTVDGDARDVQPVQTVKMGKHGMEHDRNHKGRRHRNSVHNQMEKKTFCCPHCHCEFKVESSFMAHVRAHQKEKNFQCPSCFNRYQKREELMHHFRERHPEMMTM